MFLRRLVLENVRSIERLEMPFDDGQDNRKWTLLLGENGCGKSTVLRSIALLLAGSDALPELLGDPNTWIRLNKPECAVEADIATADGDLRKVRLTIKRDESVRSVFDNNRSTLDELDRALAHTPRNYFTVGYGVSRRLSSEPTVTVAQGGVFRNVRSQSVATLFSPDATLNPLEVWATDLHYRRGERGLRLVRDTLAGLLPGVELDRIDREQRRLLFNTVDGIMPLSALSDGYQNVAAWIGDLLYRLTEAFADRSKPLEARGLLLVDEIDLHLHPVWKRQLIDFLSTKLPRFQIVATTHSPQTAQQAGPNELFLLQREPGSVAPHLYQFQGEPRTMMLHQLLMTPIFGLETVDSLKVEEDRRAYRALLEKADRTRAEQRELDRLRVELQSQPDWSRESPSEASQRALLERIDAALALANSSSGQRAGGTSTASGSPRRERQARPRRSAQPSGTAAVTTATRGPLGDGRGALVKLS